MPHAGDGGASAAPGPAPPAWSPTLREPVYAVGIRVLDGWVRARFRLRVHGLGHVPPSGPALIAPNHVSYEDPLAVFVAAHRAGRRVRAVAVGEAFERPVVGWVLRQGRQIPLHPGRGDETLAAAHAALAAGELVLLYPEGTIPGPGQRVTARRGLGWLAIVARAPIIPVTSWGLARHGSGRRVRGVRSPVGLVIGPPLVPHPSRGYGDVSPRALAEHALARVRRQLPAARRLAAARGR